MEQVCGPPLMSAVIGMSADLSLIGVMIKSVRLPLYPSGTRPKGEGVFLGCCSMDGCRGSRSILGWW